MPQWERMAAQIAEQYSGSAVTYVVLAVIVLWLVMHCYYRKIVGEVRRETGRVAQLTNLMLQIIEGAGLATLRRDDKGEVVGATVKPKASDGSK